MKERKSYVDSNFPLSVRSQAKLLEIDRSSIYYKSKGESAENQSLMVGIATFIRTVS